MCSVKNGIDPENRSQQHRLPPCYSISLAIASPSLANFAEVRSLAITLARDLPSRPLARHFAPATARAQTTTAEGMAAATFHAKDTVSSVVSGHSARLARSLVGKPRAARS